MTCAKQTVVCIIEAKNGDVFRGVNECANPQKECPRLPGEGYAKCHSVCQQYGHAEVIAVNKFTGDPEGAVAHVIGHTRVCDSCMGALTLAGITEITFL